MGYFYNSSQKSNYNIRLLGVCNEAAGITSGVHTTTFNIDEKALEIGAGLMAWLALKELSF